MDRLAALSPDLAGKMEALEMDMGDPAAEEGAGGACFDEVRLGMIVRGEREEQLVALFVDPEGRGRIVSRESALGVRRPSIQTVSPGPRRSIWASPAIRPVQRICTSVSSVCCVPLPFESIQ